MQTIYNNLLYEVDEKPSWKLTFVLALQHISMVYTGIVIMPLLIGRAVGLSVETMAFLIFVTVLISAVTTLIQIYKLGHIGSGLVLFMGSAGCHWSVSQSALVMGGIPLLMTMNIVSAFVELIIAGFLLPLRRIFTPAVGGVIIMLIPVIIMPSIMDSYYSEVAEGGLVVQNLIVVGITSLFMIGCYFFASVRLRTMMVLFGLIVGIVLSSLCGLMDWTGFADVAWIGLPGWQFYLPAFNFSPAEFSLLAGFILATVSSTIETLGDTMAAESVSYRKFSKNDYSKVRGALYADGLGNILAGLFGGLSNTTYSCNIPLLKITRVSSKRVGGMAVLMLLFLGFSPKASALFLLIPNAVLIPITIFMFAFLFVSGISLASRSQDRISQIIVGISFLVGLLGQQKLLLNNLFSGFLEQLLSNGMAAGGLCALTLTVISNFLLKGKVEILTELDKKKVSQLLDTIEQETQIKYFFSVRDQQRLRLCAEELFVFMCDQKPDSGLMVKFSVYLSARDYIVCDVVLNASIVDVDVLPEDIKPGEHLDLIILNKLASRVEHVRSGTTDYITFELHPEE